MKIFLTGGSGFVGRHFLKSVEGDGHKVLALSRQAKTPFAADVLHLKGDLSRFSEIRDQITSFEPEVCVHLAWRGIPDYSRPTCRENLLQSMQLIDHLSSLSSVKKVVSSGSCWEYGKLIGQCSEGDLVLAPSTFAWAKNALYDYGRMTCVESGKKFIWFRIFFVFGEGQRANALIPSLIQSYKAGKKVEIKSPLNENDFVHVSDVVDAFKTAVLENIPSGIYNLGTGRTTSVHEICQQVEAEVNGVAGKGIKQIGQAAIKFWADTSKAKSVLNWRPRVSVEEGIKRLVSLESNI